MAYGAKVLHKARKAILIFFLKNIPILFSPCFAEELGFIGGFTVIILYFMIILIAFATAFYCRHQFGRLLAMGISMTLFLYIFVNLGMVMSILPVVGVPLPLLSYGGSALITTMFSVGLLLSIHIHRDTWTSGLSE